MRFQIISNVSIEQLFEDIKSQFPEYKATLKKNPLLRFQYIELRKSATVGVWIRIRNNNNFWIAGAIPSPVIRALFGGLILYVFIVGKMKKIEKQIGGYVREKYTERN